MKKILSIMIVVLMALPGCWGKKDVKKTKPKKNQVTSNVDIPVVDEEIKSFFDEDVNEFALIDDLKDSDFDFASDLEVSEIEKQIANEMESDFFWVEDTDGTFKTVYFDFDKYDIKSDQEEYISANINLVKDMIEEGKNPQLTIEGNACSSSGSKTYNMAISNSRADIVAKRFVDAGIPAEIIKVVGRGSDNPELDKDGNPISGDKDQQWLNRRVEVRVYS